jgi:hypothetical protein
MTNLTRPIDVLQVDDDPRFSDLAAELLEREERNSPSRPRRAPAKG